MAITSLADAAKSGLIPQSIATGIITQAAQESVVLQRARRMAMSSTTTTMPLVTIDGEAKFLNGLYDHKPTADISGAGKLLTAEEVALIIPLPDALVADAGIDLWAEVTRLAQAELARTIDKAVLTGVGRPASWEDGLIPQAIAAGNVVSPSATTDLAAATWGALGKVAQAGFRPNGLVGNASVGFQLAGARGSDGQFVFGQPGLDQAASVYGLPLDYAMDGVIPDGSAELLAVDWSKVVIGIRSDVSFKIFDSGVIQNQDGSIRYNLVEQDMRALRMVVRVGYATAAPTGKVPAAVVTPGPDADGHRAQ